jgi:hypothetical protein
VSKRSRRRISPLGDVHPLRNFHAGALAGPSERKKRDRLEAREERRSPSILPPVVPTGRTLAGFSGHDPLPPATAERKERGIAEGRRSSALGQTTNHGALQGFYGSDGTRTRDLRRARHVPRTRRLATIDAQSLYSCSSTVIRHLISAQLRRVDFGRLLPFCCPRNCPPCVCQPSMTVLARTTAILHWRDRERAGPCAASAADSEGVPSRPVAWWRWRRWM